MTLHPGWAPFVADPASALVGVDFDGSLAPIVDDPERAAPLPEALDALGALAARDVLVAVVTGRPVAFVRRHLTDPAVAVVGQYGLERDEGGVMSVDPRAAAFAAAVAAAADEAEKRWPALRVERKGRIALTIHWRTAPADAPAPDDLERLATRHGLVAVPARMACELRPPLPVDKGRALTDLLGRRHLTAAAFAGDDHGDLAAFAALADWAGRATDRRALRVAVASAESPPELVVSADLVLAGPRELAAQLAALARALG